MEKPKKEDGSEVINCPVCGKFTTLEVVGEVMVSEGTHVITRDCCLNCE